MNELEVLTIPHAPADGGPHRDRPDHPDPEARVVYAHALRRGRIRADEDAIAAEFGMAPAAVRSAVETLTGLHLLRVDDGADQTWLVPVDPEVATATLISPIDEEVRRRTATINRIRRQLSVFRPQYESTRRAGAGTDIEELRSPDELAGRLHLAAVRCTSGFVAFHPNHYPGVREADVRRLVPGGSAMLDRGVHVRMLLQHSVRTDIRTRSRLDPLIRAGAEVRTTGELSRQLMVFDASVAFLLHRPDRAGTFGVAIRNESAVQLLLDLVEATWSAAEPYSAKEIGYHEVADDLHRAIVRLLTDGLTDEAVARRLGISVRTCRRHIAMVLRDLDAVSRFQAGVRVGAAGPDAPGQLIRDGGSIYPASPEHGAPDARQ
ncbi:MULTISPECIES: helix-turn-helix transcriptional regulator [Actinomadura]|uniref:HTH luxR-type domain-containing protein n=1 Tax=Actinomadura madurae TaxID=1993 RepID=A0A1I5IDB3_9ACTN|nr:hypothetical protein [Actinomadura madurae]SFO58444.1 hypothetical protein SAMN04489713_107271 [Actinomadura madurae]